MLEVTLEITFTVQGPILTQATAVGASGIATPFAVNARGQRFLPGTLIKGRLRQAWYELHAAAPQDFHPPIEALLGQASGNVQNAATSVAPARGRLHVADFVEETQRPTQMRYRIALDEQRGAVTPGAYQVIDAPYGVGEHVVFTGRVQYRAATSEDALSVRRDVELGLRWITSVGAGRTVGFGRLRAVTVTPTIRPVTPAPRPTAIGGPVLAMQLRPRAPFCLARRPVATNLFVSETSIPGAVLKGCLASTWRALLGFPPDGAITPELDPTRPALCRHFEHIRMTHAFPTPAAQAQRPVTVPLSLVQAHDQWYDVALCDGPVLLGTPPMAPAFSVDWKPAEQVRIQQQFGWAEPSRELRVRTAIDAKRRKAQEAQLFAYDMVVPDGVVWSGLLDLGLVPAATRAAVEAELWDLLAAGLQGLGKTKSLVDIQLANATSVPALHPSQSTPRDGVWIVTLQTPALLCDPMTLHPTSRQADLHAAYAAVWAQLSAGALQLERLFAQQTLAGGYYLARRFQPGRAYLPYLLTSPGSVFVLRAVSGQEAAAQHYLEAWLAHGLPLPAWAVQRYARDSQPGDHWTTCPYLREGGYGEIAVNLAVHWSARPQPGQYQALRPGVPLRGQTPLGPPPSRGSVAGAASPSLEAPPTFTQCWLIRGTLTTRSPMRVGSGDSTTRPALRHPQTQEPVQIAAVTTDAQGRAYLPGSTLKGMLRAWAHAVGLVHLDTLFGSADPEAPDSVGGTVEFHDALALDATPGAVSPPYWDATRLTGVTAHVALDRLTRTASPDRLFYQEYVPPGVRFAVTLTAPECDLDAIMDLLGLCEGFNSGAVTVGAATQDGWGGLHWVLTDLQRLTAADVRTWIRAGAPTVGDAIPHSMPPAERQAIERQVQHRIGSTPARAMVTLDITLHGASHFLVNDPSQTGAIRDQQTGHAPLRDAAGHVVLPASAFRGVLRSQAEKILRTLHGSHAACTPAAVCAPVETLADVARRCLACQLFGAAGWRSPLAVTDFRTPAPVPEEQLLTQEFLAIDRFTGGGAEHLKFNAKALYQPTLTGQLSVDLQALARAGVGRWALGLLALTLRDLMEGDIRVGFGAAKGYGAVRAEMAVTHLPDWHACPVLFTADLQPELWTLPSMNALAHDELQLALQLWVEDLVRLTLPTSDRGAPA